MQLSLLLFCIVSALSWQFNFVGAMENWGLITYRETCLLVDPKNTSTIQKQWIALTVGHEIAHQWFGNLVTMVRTCMLGTLQ
jgi:aminopeptidase N